MGMLFTSRKNLPKLLEKLSISLSCSLLSFFLCSSSVFPIIFCNTRLVLAVFLSEVFQKLVAHQKIIFCDYLFQFFLDDSSFSFFHDFTGFFIVFFKWKDPQFNRNDTDGKCSLNLFWGTWNLMVLKIHENMLSVIWKMDI